MSKQQKKIALGFMGREEQEGSAENKNGLKEKDFCASIVPSFLGDCVQVP